MKEETVETYFVRRVKEALGAEVRKVKWIGRRNATDRVVMLKWAANGRTTKWVELKKPAAKPRIGQLREHQRMREAGQDVYVIDSFEGVDDFIATV